MLRLILPLIIFIAVITFLWRGLHADPHLITSPLIGKKIPEFVAMNLEGKQPISDKDFSGHVTVLNVFATWCLSCHEEHPMLMDLHNKGLVVIYGLDYKDERKAVTQWLAQYGNPYSKIIFDPLGKLGINLGVYGTPETFLIDQQGIIRDKYIGSMTADELQNQIIPEINRLLRDSA